MTDPVAVDVEREGEQDPDLATVRLLLARNQLGLTRLLADHAGIVRQRLRMDFGKMLDDHHLDDAMNQATHRVWVHFDQYKPASGSLRAWFLVIARNIARRMLRALPTRLFYLSDLDAVTCVAPQWSGEGPSRESELELLYSCIRLLPPLQRDIVLADLAAGGSAPSGPLAKELGTNRTSIYTSRYEARLNLRSAMKDHPERVQARSSAMEEVE